METTGHDDPPRTLCEFVRAHETAIIAAWTRAIRRLSPAQELSDTALVDHLPKILQRIANDVATLPVAAVPGLADAPKVHALDRLAHGFDLDEVIREYNVLRRAILDLWRAEMGPAITVDELARLDAALDDSIRESSVRYARSRERLLAAVDQISEAALGTTDVDAFLRRLLTATLELTESVETVAVYLLADDGVTLRLRSSVGLEQDVDSGFSMPVGVGFTGKVALERRPHALRDASASELLIASMLRKRNVHALYGVPLVHAGRLIGVVHMGSSKAYEFSDEDQLLFRTMANRATMGIVQAQLATAERAARDDLEKERARLAEASALLERAVDEQRFLADATRALSESLEFEATLTRLATLIVPRFADWCAIEVVDGDQIRPVACAHRNEGRLAELRAFRKRFPPRLDGQYGVPKALRTRAAELFEDVTPALVTARATGEEHVVETLALGMRSVMIVPLVARDRALGAITFVLSEPGRAYTQRDLQLAENLASRAALAADNGALFEEAERATRMREEILAVVSHDLKNPLAAISLSTGVLAKALRGTPSEQHLGVVQRASDRMLHLIGALLDTANIQAGRLSIVRAAVDAAALVAEAVDMQAALALDKGISLEKTVDGAAGAEIRGDRERLLEVLSNLIGNALKFTPTGGAIKVGATPHDDGRAVLFSVADNGVGVAPAELSHVFEPYWSAKRGAQKSKSVGLGLYIAKNIVEAHGGRIWAESGPGAGATFLFTVPTVTCPT